MLFPPSGVVFDGWVMVWLGFAQWCLVAGCLVISVVMGLLLCCLHPALLLSRARTTLTATKKDHNTAVQEKNNQ